MPRSSFTQETHTWERLVRALEERAGALTHLAENRIRLAAAVAQLKKLAERQAIESGRLRATNRAMREARRVAHELESRLRAGLRAHFGARGNELFHFGSRPLRRRRQGGAPNIEAPLAAVPPETAADPPEKSAPRAGKAPAPKGRRPPKEVRRAPQEGRAAPKKGKARPK
ncbi:MAG TPA: hypothetical protein VOA87_20525 [Thermoanaerobaculia bacterium]|nr:hypothetical protein [Thermoanaerobaculia bacterium]